MNAAKLVLGAFNAAGCLVLVACAVPSPNPAILQAGQEKAEGGTHALAPAPAQSASFSGRLVLYGNELEAWLGVRDAQGQVLRLAFDSPSQFDAHRAWQNQNVQVWGTALPAQLGQQRIRVVRLVRSSQ